MNKFLLSVAFSLMVVADCNAQTWNSVGGGLWSSTGGPVEDMVNYNGQLYVAGNFEQANGFNVYGIAKWNGSQWDSLPNSTWGGPSVLCAYNNELIAAGQFNSIGGVANTFHLGRWDGSTWKSCGTNSSNTSNAQFKALAVYKGDLYVAGNFTKIGGVNVNRIAKWNGTSWSAVGTGVTGSIEIIDAMIVYNDELYVGGEFTNAGGKVTPRIARWNGTQWNQVGTGMNGSVVSFCIDTINNILYAGGGFTFAGGKFCYGIAQWDGYSWDNVGSPITEGASGMAVYHNELFVGGYSESVNDTALARWDGNAWFPIQGFDNTVYSMGTYNSEVYVGGAFTTPASYIAKYSATLDSSCNYLQAKIFASDTVNYYNGDSSMVQFQNNNKYAASWQWSFGDGETDTIQNPVHYYTTPGTYNVQVIVTYNGCIDTATTVVVVQNVTGIKEHQIENAFKVFPNPAKDEITIRIDAGIKINEPKIEIFDIAGKKVKEINNIKGNEGKISLSDLSKGVYFVKLLDKKGKEYSIEKLVIQ